MNERDFLCQLESADPDELAQILRRPTADEQRVLEIYYGVDRLERLRRLALRGQRRGLSRGNVVVLHGIMGAELTVFPANKSSQSVWLNVPRLALGALSWLRMKAPDQSEYDVRPTGILKRWYSEMLVSLMAEQWNVRSFAYDWRLDLATSADALRNSIDGWFGPDAKVNLVAHSMGGLVSRTYILRHAKRWQVGGRLIMLGTPNHGSFAVPQVITGRLGTVRMLAAADLTHNRDEITAILNGFPGSMQMLPSPLVMPTMAPMYEAATWQPSAIDAKLLVRARQSHEQLAKIVDGSRMSYIAGCNQRTPVDVANWTQLGDGGGYKESPEGDGTVAHRLGFLMDGGKRIPTFFIECEHGALPNHEDVIAATQSLLIDGTCVLAQEAPKSRALIAAPGGEVTEADVERMRELAKVVRGRTRSAVEGAALVTREESEAAALLARGFLAAAPTRELAATTEAEPVPAKSRATPSMKIRVQVRLVHADLDSLAEASRRGRAAPPAIDAISVGHYAGVAPQNAEAALDRAISGTTVGADGGLLAALHRRGAVSGTLGQNFQLIDPRDQKRVIVLAGMGQPGTFREPELAVLVRELVWMLGRSNRKHLQTVTIGAGAGNLQIGDAMLAWMRGIRRAMFDAAHSNECLQVITFVEHSASKFLGLDAAIRSAVTAVNAEPGGAATTEIDYVGPSATQRAAARAASMAEAIAAARRIAMVPIVDERKVEPVRLTIRLVRDTYEFAALTSEASIPQRDIQIDPRLVDEANNRLPDAADVAMQSNYGHLLGRLLFPNDLRERLVHPDVPLVVTVDAATARVHWEMVALAAAHSGAAVDSNFLGTTCGLTRQLRTSFAPLPEPQLLNKRVLRVLVIADPAEDAPLPGAQEEGEAVAAIFEEFGRNPAYEVEVVRLFGPGEASRVAVLDQLINNRFDLLHFAGHCFFNADDPAASGWIFRRDPLQVLTAHELNRIDRIPRFVFSNACESGITPDRASARNAMLAPSFAEAFFARGVANFICTAWPVNDTAALVFARRLYRGLLNLAGRGRPEAAHEAMTQARLDVVQLGADGMQTWGAYQHYGDPNFRLLQSDGISQRGAAPEAVAVGARRKAKPKASKRSKARVIARRKTTRRARLEPRR